MTWLSIDKPVEEMCSSKSGVDRLTKNFNTNAKVSTNLHTNSIYANIFLKELFFSFENSFSV